ncbi:MAG: NUDIX hydrolase [Nitrosomonas sp.]|jgi:ADP-ribose pyrophosphatase YjhB (NUDIX family)|uniref:NUDIX hydrolase n=1 Tax=Nitrosomonas sp. TaxID=42353 RepID=UPI002724C233|nr:NUDIX hydrolase [Nitrosomonas sp.]MDO8895535.1 NUDIX hydrolase [Nitrosomonas sp.]MDO9310556.1 NUDIX hydrolase [Nitrosomonas sp.]MDO9470823.1 NUDIX hydrolase [Nitrosomonas sp.]MDP1786847.1 NUDIX hydrolase [Nitrosomonas sp.]MDP2223903.1 NUDIX hydrolase [Nitrosomonas sp.]
MKYCSNCSATVELLIPEGDSLPRYVCTTCNIIHYQNPKMVVGCIPEWEDKILLCRRAIEPRLGWWTLPAGFMENNETLEQAAARETLEEANARVEIGNLYAIYSLPHISQVYLLFRARLLDLDFKPGIESLEVKLLSENEIPWEEMAFRVIHDPLMQYFKERKLGKLGFHRGVIDRPRNNP